MGQGDHKGSPLPWTAEVGRLSVEQGVGEDKEQGDHKGSPLPWTAEATGGGVGSVVGARCGGEVMGRASSSGGRP